MTDDKKEEEGVGEVVVPNPDDGDITAESLLHTKYVMTSNPELRRYRQMELAKVFVGLMNSHRMDHLIFFFDDDAAYTSTTAGSFTGKMAIAGYLKRQFDTYPDIKWTVPIDTYQHKGNDTVEYEYIVLGTSVKDGSKTARKGTNNIRFSNAGHIERIKIRSARIKDEELIQMAERISIDVEADNIKKQEW